MLARALLRPAGMLVGALALTLGICGVPVARAVDPVTFPDAHLQACVDNALAASTPWNPVTPETLPRLMCPLSGISDLRGLEQLTGLDTIVLSGNNIADLTPLSALTGLTHLELGGNQITDMAPLKTLTRLIQLELSSNHIRTITGLEGMTSLVTLNLAVNEISEITGLDALANLAELELNANHITAITGLDRLTRLVQLRLGSNQISSTRGLEQLTHLVSVELDHNNISTVTGVENLVSTGFNVTGNSIGDVSWLGASADLDARAQTPRFEVALGQPVPLRSWNQKLPTFPNKLPAGFKVSKGALTSSRTGTYKLPFEANSSNGRRSWTGTATIVVTLRPAKISASASKAVRAGKAGKLKVKVSVSGTKKPTGKVTVFSSGRKLKTVTLKASNKGTVSIKLPKLGKGSHSLTVSFKGSTAAGATIIVTNGG